MASPTGGQFVFSNGTQTVHLGLSQNGSVPTATNAGTDLNIEVFVNPGTTTLPTLAAGFDAGVIVTDSVNGVVVTGSTNQELLGGQKLTLFGSNYQVIDNSTDTVMSVHQAVTIQGGSGNQTLVGATGDTILGGSGAQVLDSGNESIVGGSGPVTIFGAAGDTILAGSGSAVVFGGGTGDSAKGGVTPGGGALSITVGSSGNDTIYGSLNRPNGVGADTLFGGAASAYVDGLGAGDAVNFANQSGNSTVFAALGNVSVTLGGGAATVYGGAGDKVTGGTGAESIFGGGFTGKNGVVSAGGAMSITVGAAGSESITGSFNRPIGVGADTLTGGGASVYLEGLGSGDVVNFANQSGNSTINALPGNVSITLGSGATTLFGGSNDTISLGSGAAMVQDSGTNNIINIGSNTATVPPVPPSTVPGTAVNIFAGLGDTINGGSGASTVYLPGSDTMTFGNSTGNTTVNAQVGNDSITLGSGGKWTVFAQNNATVAGDSVFTGLSGSAQTWFSSATNAVVGENNADNSSTAQDTVVSFSQANGDSIHYTNVTTARSNAIVSSATTSNGNTTFILPDGSTMTLLGVSKINNTFFK